ncbi:helix-turn-helix domain-containing protein [Flavobacterium inviolabile]|uniref:helix-turn-helix domain-containing protein n=1 Tax=Flavobacterium inviolabile TaxID=2748320 RepID=UPI0015AB6EDA|nr:helix-turn-helix domain-containing protein [Flavobacterium inviolabile]
MSILKNIREQQNLTQEELADRSGISTRTIQRIEAGTKPKGYTLKILAKTLGIKEEELLHKKVEEAIAGNPEEKAIRMEEPVLVNYSLIKLINLSSILFVILPPLNILFPVVLMFTMKQKNQVIRQIISIQIIWTIAAPIIFMMVIFTKPGNKVTLFTMIVLALVNIYIILRNAMEIDRNKKLYYRLNFSMI